MNTRRFHGAIAESFVLLALIASSAPAADWPAYRHDNRRSAATDEQLLWPMALQWVRKSPHPPAPAWPAPAPNDNFHNIPKLYPTATYDWAFHSVVVGGLLYYGSSADDTIYCVDAATGKTRWSFVTEGPVRLAPAVEGGRVFAGSDDGYLYCLDAQSGKLLWRHRAGPDGRRLPGNERMISLWPVRCGPVVEDGTVYFAAGVFPSRQVFLSAASAKTGEKIWQRTLPVIPAQGYPVLGTDRLIAPSGRTWPCAFRRDNGADLGNVPGGGTFGMLLDDLCVFSAGEQRLQLQLSNARTLRRLLATPGIDMVADVGAVYILGEDSLRAVDRKTFAMAPKDGQPTERWRVPSASPCALIRAGNTLIVGGENRVTAHAAADGRTLWSATVAGRALGLAVSDGRLLVSTNEGTIYCFARGEPGGAAAVVTTSDGTVSPYPKDDLTARYEQVAETAIRAADTRKGYCLVLGAGTGRLAYEIARRSEFQVVGIESDPVQVAAARDALARAGLYGRHVAMHQASAERLPYPGYFANLIVSDAAVRTGKLPETPPDELLRVLRPCGGAIVISGAEVGPLQRWGAGRLLGWTVVPGKIRVWGTARRGPLPGAGEWTHAFADPANTFCSRDTLVHGPLDLQWFGRPGPEAMVERHLRNVAPLYKNGRVFIPGDERVFAVDAYNGTPLWQADLPGSRRLRVVFDSGGMAVDDELLYWTAADKCHGLDVQTGRTRVVHSMPQPVADQPYYWGWIAYDGDVLLGSGARPGAAYMELTKLRGDQPRAFAKRTVEKLQSVLRQPRLVTSNYLFGLDRRTGKELWQHRSGRIVNSTLAMGGGRVFFVESRSPEALADTTGRLTPAKLFAAETILVALDARTGKTVYREPVDVRHIQECCYINYGDEVVLLSGARADRANYRYYYQAFAADTGKRLWATDHDSGLTVGSGHGSTHRDPVIMGDTVHAWPYAYKLKTGKRVEGYMFSRRGGGCGGVSASAHALFWRAGYPMMHDLSDGSAPVHITSESRPGCWINIIPVGGLVLIPEASSGCSCPYPVQTSIALAPHAEEPRRGESQ